MALFEVIDVRNNSIYEIERPIVGSSFSYALNEAIRLKLVNEPGTYMVWMHGDTDDDATYTTFQVEARLELFIHKEL